MAKFEPDVDYQHDRLITDPLVRIINIQMGSPDFFGTFTVFLASTLSPLATGGPPGMGNPPVVFRAYLEDAVPLIDPIGISFPGTVNGEAIPTPQSVTLAPWSCGGAEWFNYSDETGSPIFSTSGASVNVSVINRTSFHENTSFDWGGSIFGAPGEYITNPADGPVIATFTLDWSHVRATMTQGGAIRRPVGFRVSTGKPEVTEVNTDPPALVEILSVSILDWVLDE